jgi:hypothetical protein
MKIPRKPPTLEQRTERERVMRGLGKWVVTPVTSWCDAFNGQDSPHMLRIYALMANHAERTTRIVRIGQQRIATALHIHRHTVGANLRKLERRGLLQRVARMPPPSSIIIWRFLDTPDLSGQIQHAQARHVEPDRTATLAA